MVYYDKLSFSKIKIGFHTIYDNPTKKHAKYTNILLLNKRIIKINKSPYTLLFLELILMILCFYVNNVLHP